MPRSHKPKEDFSIELFIAEYCALMGITREQYDAMPLLLDSQIPALQRLQNEHAARPGDEGNVIVPEGLPGGGKRWSELSELESEHLATLEVEWGDPEYEEWERSLASLVTDEEREHAPDEALGTEAVMSESSWAPPDTGTKGRRAQAWFTTVGLVVAATDADVAGHAMAVVMEALPETAQLVDSRFMNWSVELIAEFPELPDEACSEHERSRGKTDVSIENVVVGMGYVRTVAGGHECGGAIFDRTTHSATRIQPEPIWLSASRTAQ